MALRTSAFWVVSAFSVTAPAFAQTAAADPAAAEAPAAEPPTSEPHSEQPAAAEMRAAEPALEEPLAADSSVAEPLVVETVPLAPPVAAAPARVNVEAPPKITDHEYRDTRQSAYTLPGKRFAFNTALFSVAGNDVFAGLGLQYGLSKGVQLGVNIAHAGAGVLNLAGKWTFLEKGPLAVAAEFNPTYVHGDWLWPAPFETLFAGIDMFVLPVKLQGSALLTPWLQFDLAASYVGGIIVGNVTSTNVDLDAEIIARQFVIQPGVRFHLLGRSTLLINADLPLYTAMPASIAAEVELEPGVIVGGTLDGTKTKSLEDTYRIEVGVRSMVTKALFLEFGLTFGPRTELLFGSPVYPRVGVEVRL